MTKAADPARAAESPGDAADGAAAVTPGERDAANAALKRVLEAHDMVELLYSKRRLLWLNFWLGLLRGLGFFLGMTLVGALLLGLLIYLFDWAGQAFRQPLVMRNVVRELVDKYYEVVSVVDQVKSEHQSRGPGADGGRPDSTDERKNGGSAGAEPAEGSRAGEKEKENGPGGSEGGDR
ncbi:MAG: DUF5665 domain-containing protein [Planctomycetota bacterium]